MMELRATPSSATQVCTEAGNEVYVRNASAQRKPISDANRSADQALDYALGQELAQDIGFGRTQGAPQSYFFGPLRDADQHHVHDHDSPDDG